MTSYGSEFVVLWGNRPSKNKYRGDGGLVFIPKMSLGLYSIKSRFISEEISAEVEYNKNLIYESLGLMGCNSSQSNCLSIDAYNDNVVGLMPTVTFTLRL